MKFLIIIFLLIPFGLVFANGNHTTTPPPPSPPPVVTTTTATTTLITSYEAAGVASAIAAGQCQFDWTHSWQGCAAVGTYDGNGAAAFGIGKRYNEVLFNGTVSIEEGEIGLGGSVNWKFK